jgi:xanthine dehydrogenase accessory factor
VARAAGYDVLRGDAPAAHDAAFVAASHGEGEEAALARALQTGVGYVGLVASPRRGRAVVASLDVPGALREMVHTPAGLDIGARAPADVAISILAEIVATRTAHAPAPAPATAVDPVCGMAVAAAETTVHADVDGTRHYFCCDGCRSTYLASLTP